MIHKVRYGYMEVVPKPSLTNERAPDLTFKGAEDREFVVFFAPAGTIDGEDMKAAYYDYYAPYDAVKKEQDDEAL